VAWLRKQEQIEKLVQVAEEASAALRQAANELNAIANTRLTVPFEGKKVEIRANADRLAAIADYFTAETQLESPAPASLLHASKLGRLVLTASTSMLSAVGTGAATGIGDVAFSHFEGTVDHAKQLLLKVDLQVDQTKSEDDEEVRSSISVQVEAWVRLARQLGLQGTSAYHQLENEVPQPGRYLDTLNGLREGIGVVRAYRKAHRPSVPLTSSFEDELTTLEENERELREIVLNDGL
jgi:hypothetical protein